MRSDKGDMSERESDLPQFLSSIPEPKVLRKKVSTAIPAIEPGSTAMLARPVAVLPLACGRLELGRIRRREEEEEETKQKMQKIARCNEKGAHPKGEWLRSDNMTALRP